jgi:phosphate transport system permease protein
MSVQAQETGIARPPTGGELLTDRGFRGLTFSFAWFTILLVVLIIMGIGWQAWPALERFHTEPLTSAKWDGKEHFGLLPEIWGTIYSSVLGVAMQVTMG